MPEPANLLVIGGFISPSDSIIQIHVGKTVSTSSSLNMAGGDTVENATVILSGNGLSATLAYDEVYRSYVIPFDQFPIAGGHTYFLTVSTPDGLAAQSQTTVPAEANTSLDYTIDSIVTEPYGYKQKELLFSVSWQDMPGQANYYRLHGQYQVGNTSSNPNPNDPYYYNMSAIYFGSMYQSEYFISDKATNGGMIGPVNGQCYIYGNSTGEKHTSIMLLTVDKNYYEYYSSLWNVNQDDPFSEPQNVFTNIEGGLGVFGSYQQYVVKKDFN